MSARLATLHTPFGGAQAHARVTRDPVPPGRVPVMVVHGVGLSSRAVQRLLRVLGTHFPMVAPELLGLEHDRRRDEGGCARTLAEELLRWMDALELAQADLVARSVGCRVAVETALLAPGRVRRLVLQSPILERARDLGGIVRDLPRRPLGSRERSILGPRGTGTVRRMALLASLAREPIDEHARIVFAPTLVVSDDGDPIATPVRCQQLVETLPDGRHTVLSSWAPAPSAAGPEQLTRAVRPFLLGEEPPTHVNAPMGGAPRYMARLDPGSATVRACSRSLEGEDSPALATRPPAAILGALGHRLPSRFAEGMHAVAARAEAVPPRHLARARMEEADRWMVAQYPQQRYPAMLLGSAGGAAVHLAAALGAPFFPQTLLVPVRRAAPDVDDLHAAMIWGRSTAAGLLEANPDHALHQVHDPSRDRPMARHVAPFRLKRRRLGSVLEQFCATRLEPGATLFVLDCRLRWPVTRVSDRHVFQAGAVGALTPEEYLYGGPRVAAFMRSHGRERLSFRAPLPDETAPEAEWGLDPALIQDVQRVARAHGLRVQVIPYETPQSLSATVADLYRNWYARLGRPTWRLVAESFVLTDPTWVLRTSSVPYWCTFPTERSAGGLEEYLLQTPGVRELHVLLFPHGADSAGMAPPDRWLDLVHRVGRGGLVGVDARPFPRGFGSLARYRRALERVVTDRYPWPSALSVDEVACFLAERGAQAPPRPRSGEQAP